MSNFLSRVLIIAPTKIGEAVIAQTLFISLKKIYPGLLIDVLAEPAVSPVFERMSEINTVFIKHFKKNSLQLWQRWLTAIDLRKQNYDAAYILSNTYVSAFIPKLAGISLRIGYLGTCRYGWLNVIHPNQNKKNKLYSLAQYYSALAYLPKAKVPEMIFKPRLEADYNESNRLYHRFNLDTRLPLISFCSEAEHAPSKRWPVENFIKLAKLIKISFPYCQIIILGSQKEVRTANEIVKQVQYVSNLCGQTSLNEACALLSRTAVNICNDTGLMHIASALRRPLIALYGSTDPRHAPPLSDNACIKWLHLDCSPCYKSICPLKHHHCMQLLTPEKVFNEMRQLMKLSI